MPLKTPTQSPEGAICSKCGEPIPTGIGRRYRMKWCHEKCLPQTRLDRINHPRDEELRLQKGIESNERVREAIRQFVEKNKERYG